MLYSNDYNNRIPSFINWLSTRPRDLTTGRLYPYLKSRGVYSCPTDKLEISAKARTKAAMNSARNYSYSMNCGICHATDLSKFSEPSKSVVFLEASIGLADHSGIAGPSGVNQALAYRHAKRGHLVMGDLSISKLNRKEFEKASRHRRFWTPTDDAASGRGPL